MRYVFRVEGRPVPQGSMVASYNKKQGVARVHHQQGEALALWRGLVRIAAREAGAIPSPLPIRLSVRFGMQRPKAHLRLRGGRYVVKVEHYYDRPAVAPDIDKLIRAIGDALTGVAYVDDSQIVDIVASKVYEAFTLIEVSDEEGSVSSELGADSEENPSEGQLRLPDMP